jgi:ABC-type nickel/cobalt efflux system permease component RcnA
MPDLYSAYTSGDLLVILATAGFLGIFHTVLGPDHYIPFVMMSRAQNWSRRKTSVITFLCGVGHVSSSLVIGAFLAWGGMAVTEWAESKWAAIHELRGSISAWLLIGVGAAFTVWGVINGIRRRKHTHFHTHAGELSHTHEHNHRDDHMHLHGKAGSITPWILFTIFVFGPCESLIPLMLTSWSLSGLGGVALVSLIFSLATIGTMMVIVTLLLAGLNRIPLGGLERWSTALAGISLVACGGAINWLGL